MRTSSKSSFWAVAVLLSGTAALASLVACGGSGGDDRAPQSSAGAGNGSSGGAGNTAGGPAGTAGGVNPSAGAAGATVVSACGTGPFPVGDAAVVDLGGFDDGMLTLPSVANRKGLWFVDYDTTATATFNGAPATAAAKGTFKPTDGGYMGQGLHVSGTGFKGWGFALIGALNQSPAQLRCQYDASMYAGVTFWAKGKTGPKPVHFSIAETAVIPAAAGGTCVSPAPQDGDCYNAHGVDLALKETYQKFNYVWADLAQGNWGVQAAFDPKTVISLRFTVDADKETGMADFDFSIDQVAFLAPGSKGGGVEGGSAGTGAGGAAGAGGSSAGAGGASAGAGGSTAGTGGTN